MAATKGKPALEFRVQSLSEASPEYAALVAKRLELQRAYSSLNGERSKLSREIQDAKKSGAQQVSGAVAKLLGDDPVEGVAALHTRLREVVSEMSNIEAAQEVLRRRLDEARDAASKIVCDTARHEYQRRLGALCDAARALEDARQHHDALLDDLDREDVRRDYLRPVLPHFLGDRRDGKVSYFLREVKAAGHDV